MWQVLTAGKFADIVWIVKAGHEKEWAVMLLSQKVYTGFGQTVVAERMNGGKTKFAIGHGSCVHVPLASISAIVSGGRQEMSQCPVVQGVGQWDIVFVHTYFVGRISGEHGCTGGTA